MSKSVLILGGAGLLGTALTERFITSGRYIVYCADVRKSTNTSARNIQVDVLDYKSLSVLIKDKDYIINCTGQVTNPLEACLRLNSTGILNIGQAISEFGKFLIQVSSINVYGTRNRSAKESDNLNPETPYATSKALAELILTEKIENERLSILRLSNLYGVKQTKGVLGYLIKRYNTDNTDLVFNNNGNLTRYYLHYTDASDIIFNFIDQGPFEGIYNLKGPDRFSIFELVSMCHEISQKKLIARYDDIKPWENILELDDTLIRSKLNIEFQVNIREYLSEQLTVQK